MQTNKTIIKIQSFNDYLTTTTGFKLNQIPFFGLIAPPAFAN